MSYVSIWVHAVWATKNREPFLLQPFRKVLFDHIKEKASEKNIYIDRINGYDEHVHCRISVQPMHSIAYVMQMLKGESSRWVTKNFEEMSHFDWADKYFASSVSGSHVNAVRKYIDNQEKHHSDVSFSEEMDSISKRYRIKPSF